MVAHAERRIAPWVEIKVLPTDPAAIPACIKEATAVQPRRQLIASGKNGGEGISHRPEAEGLAWAHMAQEGGGSSSSARWMRQEAAGGNEGEEDTESGQAKEKGQIKSANSGGQSVKSANSGGQSATATATAGIYGHPGRRR